MTRGREGVKTCCKLCDVKYGRPLNENSKNAYILDKNGYLLILQQQQWQQKQQQQFHKC